MDCAAVKPRMEALVNGSLPESERLLAEQHIAACEGCRLELELVRAIGSQEKAPAVGKDDWTLDRIFGAEKNPGGAPDAPSSDPANDAAAESLFGPAPAASPPAPPEAETGEAEPAAETPRKWGKRAGPAPAEGNSWDFEPADAKSNVKPPEQSLFFATEALTRRKDLDSKKGSNLRVILWGVGGLAGAALLAFSAYFVLHMKPPAPDISTPGAQVPAAGETGTTTPDTPPAPAPEAVPPPASSAPAEEPAPTPPDNSAQVAPAAPPRVSASSAAPPTLPLGARATGPAPVTRTPAARHVVPATPTPRSASRPAEPGSAPAETHTRVAGPSAPETHPSPAPPSEDTPSGEPAIDSQTGATQPGNDDESEEPAPPPKATRPSTRGSSMWQNHVTKPEEQEPAPPAPAPDPNAPIERLHLATVTAAEHGDLDALRRLRTTWKSFMVKIVGPDRSRAKREYADCLWAIQDLTGRRSDQKDTLAAYREYLLGAPAGGADSRSVSRLRQLEDALSEAR